MKKLTAAIMVLLSAVTAFADTHKKVQLWEDGPF